MFTRIDDPNQLEMTPLLEKKQKAMTNAERQAKYRQEQKKLGRRAITMQLTEDEQFYLERTLLTMRKEQAVPCTARSVTSGRFVAIDV